MSADTFDYIVVGGGSGGAVVASRLSEDPNVRVCLLEAGGMGDSLMIRMPAAIAALIPAPLHNWAYSTVPQAGLNGRKGYQPRGKALGGSSAINAMLYLRGHPADYDGWALTGWTWKDVLPVFKKSQHNERGSDAWHGTGGPLNVADLRSAPEPRDIFLAAARQAGLTANPDFNGAEQEGFGPFQVTQKDGERHSTAAAFLHPHLDRPNLVIRDNAHAMQILFDGKRASGVRYRRKHRVEDVHADGEVILAGGTFGTPQLLMLSGIGPSVELKQNEIKPVHVLPGVGNNLQDHLDYTAIWKSPSDMFLGVSARGTMNLIKGWQEWQKNRTGILTSPFAEAGAFLKSSDAEDRPDIQLHYIIGIVDTHARKPHVGHGFSCHVALLRPRSRGMVGLNSASPFKQPRIDPGFLTDPADLPKLVSGYRQMREIFKQSAFDSVRGRELYAPADDTDAEIERLIRARADTVYHPVGTCRMGVDDASVVDPELRVNGVENLRIADASIMPVIPAGNTNAASIMIGEKCAELLMR